MNELKDFDEAWAEKEEEGYPFKVKGEEYKLPASPPAGLVIEAMRLEEEFEDEDDVPNNKVYDMAQQIVGEDNLTQMLDDDISINELRDIVEWANQVYAPGQQEGDDSGNSTSSSTGE